MPEFALEGRDSLEFRTLPDFVRGYIEAAFFTAPHQGEDAGEREGEPCPTCDKGTLAEDDDSGVLTCDSCGYVPSGIPESFGFAELAPSSLESMQLDCADFQARARRLLSNAYRRGYDETQAGRDFWFSRNGHGVGFWDRRELERGGLGDKLSEVARAFGESDFYMGDDSAVYVSPEREPPVPVLFRMDGRGRDAQCVAVFPTLVGTDARDVTIFAHVGQHGAAHRGWYARTRKATPEQFASLKAELEAAPYRYVLDVRERWTRAHDDARKAAWAEMRRRGA